MPAILHDFQAIYRHKHRSSKTSKLTYFAAERSPTKQFQKMILVDDNKAVNCTIRSHLPVLINVEMT